ncbi:MAG: hypothetical protein QXT91_00060 [Candidatus Caldarchaeum sp.]
MEYLSVCFFLSWVFLRVLLHFGYLSPFGLLLVLFSSSHASVAVSLAFSRTHLRSSARLLKIVGGMNLLKSAKESILFSRSYNVMSLAITPASLEQATAPAVPRSADVLQPSSARRAEIHLLRDMYSISS